MSYPARAEGLGKYVYLIFWLFYIFKYSYLTPNNYIDSIKYFFLIICICLHTVSRLVVWLVFNVKSSLISYLMTNLKFIYIYISILLYGCTTWTLTKRLEKKLDGNYTRMLRAILNKSWQQHPTRHQLYGHLPPITKTIQVRRTRHAGHCWRSRDELIRDVLLWIPTHGHAKAGRPARTYIQQLCEDTGYCPEDLPRAMNDREEWRERFRDIRAASTIWWWWSYIYMCVCVCVCVCVQPSLCTNRKVNFLGKFNRYGFRVFFLPSKLPYQC